MGIMLSFLSYPPSQKNRRSVIFEKISSIMLLRDLHLAPRAPPQRDDSLCNAKSFAGFDLPRAGGLYDRLLLESSSLPNQKMLQQSVVVGLGD